MGYTPNLVGGVWVGAESPKVHFRTIGLGQGANMALPIWGRFMNKVYQDPQFRHWENATFDPLPDSLYWEMDCAPYLEEMPIYVNWDSLENVPSTLFEIIFGKEQPEVIIPTEEPRTRTNRNDKYPKARKNRKPKKKKKKKFFERIFGRKN